MTSAATAATSVADTPLAVKVVMPGEDPLSGSVQAKNLLVSVLHKPHTVSPGATTSIVWGLYSLMPVVLSALMLSLSQPLVPRVGPFWSVWR
jgi:hypothetical protein